MTIKPPFLFHCDIFKAKGRLLSDHSRPLKRDEVCNAHLKYIDEKFGLSNSIFPAFNYDFSKTKTFNVNEPNSTMGVLSNFIIKNPGEFKRSPTPFFSILTKIPEIQKSINYPFGQNSPFDFLHKNNGSIIFYGTNISSNTFLHYIEALNNNGPLYRYEKKFEGTVISNNNSSKSWVKFHVRPHGKTVVYNDKKNWDRLLNAGVVTKIDENIFGVAAVDMIKILGGVLNEDPFGLLDMENSAYWKKIYSESGRRVRINDYE